MKQESEEDRNKSYQATSRVLAVETGKRGRPAKITPGDAMIQIGRLKIVGIAKDP